tara:strand:+ start:3369 stop:4094 length:726 start_codon:yes stop_codon:yes gene_type:complete
MSIQVGKIYQQVLLLTKDTRNVQLTPEKFNLIAETAQLQVFEKIFHDYKLALRKVNSQEDVGDELSLLEEKIAPFRVFNATVQVNSGNGTLIPVTGQTIYDLLRVHEANGTQDLEQVTRENFNYILRGSGVIKLTPAFGQKIFYRRGPAAIQIAPADNTDLKFDYIRKPSRPRFATSPSSPTMNQGTIFEGSNSAQFDLHASDTSALLNTILELVGMMKNDGLVIQTAGKIKATNEVNKDR